MNKKLNCAVRFLLGSESDTSINIGLLLFRVVLGIFMLTHGWQKLSNFETLKLTFADPLGVGSALSLSMIIFAELGCSVLIILGLFTRLATLPLIFGMAIAAFVIHAGDGFVQKELPLLYSGMYAVLFFIGAGKYSLDRLLYNWWNKKYPLNSDE